MELSTEDGGRVYEVADHPLVHPGLSRHATAPTTVETISSPAFDFGAPGDTFRMPHRKSPTDTSQVLDQAPFRHTRRPTGVRTRFPIRLPSNEYTDFPQIAGKPPPIPAKSHTRLTSRQKSGQVTPQSATFQNYINGSHRSGPSRDRYGSQSQSSSQSRFHVSPPHQRLQDLQASDGDVSSSDTSMAQSRARRSVRKSPGGYQSRQPPSSLGSIDEGYNHHINGLSSKAEMEASLFRTSRQVYDNQLRVDSDMTVRSSRQTSSSSSGHSGPQTEEDDDDDTQTERPTSNAPTFDETSQKMTSLPESCRYICWALDNIPFILGHFLSNGKGLLKDQTKELIRRTEIAKNHLKNLKGAIQRYERFMIPGERDKTIEIDRLLKDIFQTVKIFKHPIRILAGLCARVVDGFDDRLLRQVTWTLHYVVIELNNAFQILKAFRAATPRRWYGPRRKVEYECTDRNLSCEQRAGAVRQHKESLKTRRYGMPDASKRQFPRTASGRILYADAVSNHSQDTSLGGPRGDETRSTSRASTLIGGIPPSAGSFYEPDTPLPPLSGMENLSASVTSTSSFLPQTHGPEFDEEKKFGDIFVKVTETADLAAVEVPSIIGNLIDRLQSVKADDQRNYGRKEHAIRQMRHAFEDFKHFNDVTRKKISTMPLADPAEFSGINFWQLISSWVAVWTTLLEEFAGEIQSGLAEISSMEGMSRVNKNVMRVWKMVQESPWNVHATPAANEVANTPIMSKGEGFSSPALTTPGSTYSTSAISINVPPTPLSAALGPAAHATLTSNPYGSNPYGSSPQTPGLPQSLLNGIANMSNPSSMTTATQYALNNPPRSARSTTLAGNPMYRGKGSLARTRTTGSGDRNPSSLASQLSGNHGGSGESHHNTSSDEPQYMLSSLKTPNLDKALQGNFFLREQALRSFANGSGDRLPAALRSPYAGGREAERDKERERERERERLPLVVKKKRMIGYDGAWDED